MFYHQKGIRKLLGNFNRVPTMGPIKKNDEGEVQCRNGNVLGGQTGTRREKTNQLNRECIRYKDVLQTWKRWMRNFACPGKQAQSCKMHVFFSDGNAEALSMSLASLTIILFHRVGCLATHKILQRLKSI